MLSPWDAQQAPSPEPAESRGWRGGSPGLPKAGQRFLGLPSTTALREQVRAQHPESHLWDTQVLIPHEAKAQLRL